MFIIYAYSMNPSNVSNAVSTECDLIVRFYNVSLLQSQQCYIVHLLECVAERAPERVVVCVVHCGCRAEGRVALRQQRGDVA